MKYPLLLGLAASIACAAPAPERRSVPEWRVASTPVLTIGTTEADPGHELSQVSGARMRDGQILVANSGTHELRRFDSAGRYLGAAGRKGQGPGEFAGMIYLFPAPHDSLYTLDAGNLRWSVHDGSGKFARVVSGGPAALPRPTWLYRRALVESNGPVPVPAWALTVLDSLPPARPGSAVLRVRFDDLGHLWLRDSVATDAWTVFADTGEAVGRVVLPTGFTMFQAAADFVLGVERDSMDQEIVRAYRLGRPGGLALPAATPEGGVPPGDMATGQKLMAEVLGLMTAQELFYSEHGRYTADGDSLGATIAHGAELVLIAGDKFHWAGILYDRMTGTTCAVSIGFPAPAGWLDGSPFCGR